MRAFVITAAIVTLIGATSLAFAQDRDHRGGPDRANTPHAGAPSAPPNSATGRNAIGERQFREHHDVPSPARAASPADTMRGINRSLNGNAGRPDASRRDNNDRPDVNRSAPNRQNFNRPGSRPDSNNARRGNRGPGRDFSGARNYHQNFRASRRFRAPSYRRPPGYFARQWRWGQTLPLAFWARDYWLNDFYDYDLPPPPYGAVWVRVGDDALLIDRDSGEIITVYYGVFY